MLRKLFGYPWKSQRKKSKKLRACLVTILENSFPEQKTMKTCLTTKNYFLFYVLKNRKQSVFREYILVVLCCFHLFSNDCFKKKGLLHFTHPTYSLFCTLPQLSSKSSNVLSILYNCMQIAFFLETTLFFWTERHIVDPAFLLDSSLILIFYKGKTK